MYTYDAAATTTPKTTYTTSALSVARANPVVADSAGRFPDIFAATGEGFYCTLKTSGDVTVASFASVEALGESSTDNITRTFTASRYKVSSGEVETGNDGTLIEYGSSSPVNTGGYAKESGWAETQGTKKIVDFAAVEITGTLDVGGNMTTGGTLETGGLISEGGKDLLGVVYTGATAFTTAASVEITLPNSPSGVTSYEIYIYDFSMSAAANLQATMSFDESTYKTGASDYAYVTDSTTSGATISRDNAEAYGLVLGSTEIATGKKGVLRIRVQTTATSGDPTIIWGEWVGQFLNGGLYYGGKATFSISYVGGLTTRIMKLKLAPASGNISGTYRVVPLRGTGD